MTHRWSPGGGAINYYRRNGQYVVSGRFVVSVEACNVSFCQQIFRNMANMQQFVYVGDV